jgi:hypothetical protein
MALLFDFTSTPECCTDHALEETYKSLADRPDESIWEPHHDPLIRDHVEQATARGVAILRSIHDGLVGGIGAIEPMAKSMPWRRFDEGAFEAMRLHLESKPQSEYSLQDWLDLADWLIQRYLPEERIQTEAEYLSVRARIAGRIQAMADTYGVPTSRLPDLVAIAPVTVLTERGLFRAEGRMAHVIEYATARAAELITDTGEKTRHRIRQILIDHHKRAAMGDREAVPLRLQSRLFDEFSILNRDWRRIAITESTENWNEGFVASVPVGARIRRVEAYPTACPFCRRIHGMEFEVVDPQREDKDSWKHVWLGKTNVGRSASPRRRDGDQLVERSPEELWHPAAGAQHPNCRGSWMRVESGIDEIDPEFARWMEKELA